MDALDMMALQKAEARMEVLAKIPSGEGRELEAHIEADELLKQLLTDLGCKRLVELYRQVPKWYA